MSALFTRLVKANNRSADVSAFSETYGGLQFFLAYFNGIVLILGAVCNAIVLAVVLRNKCLHKVRYFLVCNLTVADLGICLVNFPIFLYNAARQHYAAGKAGCTLHAFFIIVFCSQSVLTLTATTYERYLTVVKGTDLSRHDFWRFLPVNWCFSFLLAAMPFLGAPQPYPLRSSRVYCTGGWYFSDPFEVVFTVLCCCVITTGLCGITLMHRGIFEAIRENTSRLRSAVRPTEPSTHLADDGSDRPGVGAVYGAGQQRGPPRSADASVDRDGLRRASEIATGRSLRSQQAIARTTLIMTATFFCCWGLYNVMFLLEMFTQRESCPLLDGMGLTTALFHSVCNPFMLLFDKNIKSAIRDSTGFAGWSSRREKLGTTPVNVRGVLSVPVLPFSCWISRAGRALKCCISQQEKKPRGQPNWLSVTVMVTVNGVGVSPDLKTTSQGCPPMAAAGAIQDSSLLVEEEEDDARGPNERTQAQAAPAVLPGRASSLPSSARRLPAAGLSGTDRRAGSEPLATHALPGAPGKRPSARGDLGPVSPARGGSVTFEPAKSKRGPPSDRSSPPSLNPDRL